MKQVRRTHIAAGRIPLQASAGGKLRPASDQRETFSLAEPSNIFARWSSDLNCRYWKKCTRRHPSVKTGRGPTLQCPRGCYAVVREVSRPRRGSSAIAAVRAVDPPCRCTTMWCFRRQSRQLWLWSMACADRSRGRWVSQSRDSGVLDLRRVAIARHSHDAGDVLQRVVYGLAPAHLLALGLFLPAIAARATRRTRRRYRWPAPRCCRT